MRISGLAEKKWVRSLLVMAAAVIIGSLAYFGLPPHRETYVAHVPSSLQRQIDGSMVEIRKKQHNMTVDKQANIIFSGWRDTAIYRYKLEHLGLAAIPYIEAKTRNQDPDVRLVAYQMLRCISTTAITNYKVAPWTSNGATLWWQYVAPIWQRALTDQNPKIRLLAAERLGPSDYNGQYFRTFWNMLRDPDEAVRLRVARIIAVNYGRPYLVPLQLRIRLQRHTEVR